MKKNPEQKKAAAKAKPQSVGRFLPPVPPNHPIYQAGYAIGGRYPKRPASKPAPTGFAAQLAGTLEQMIAEAAGDPASEEVLKKLRRNLTGESS